MVGSVLRSIWKMRPDGTDDAQAWPMPVFYLSYAVAANALYGVVARDPARRYFSVQSTDWSFNQGWIFRSVPMNSMCFWPSRTRRAPI